MRATILPGSLQTALFPRFAMQKPATAKALATHAITTIGTLMTPIVVLGLLLLKPFMIFWVGTGLAERAAPVGQILLVGIWINTLAFIPFTYLQSRGRPDLPAKFHLLELIPYIVILWVLIDLFNIAGAAWAWDLRVLIDTLLLFWAAKTTSGLSRTVLSVLPVIAAFVIAFEIAYDTVLYICISTLLTSASIVWSFVSIPQGQRKIISRLLQSRSALLYSRLTHKKI
jgi:O-antigen/teichoic acid export membrane protein